MACGVGAFRALKRLLRGLRHPQSDHENALRLLPATVDQIAEKEPEKVFLVLPGNISSKDGIQKVSYGDLKRAVDRMSEWLEDTLGQAHDSPTLAFISRPFDVRYIIALLAGMKTGYKFLLTSPRNSIENHIHLLEKTGCKTIVSDISIGKLLEESGCTQHCPPALDSLLAPGKTKNYPFLKSYDECKSQPAFVLHSSGSTGPPKPITWTFGTLAAIDAYPQALVPRDAKRAMDLYKSRPNMVNLSVLPLFHAGGIIHGMLLNIAADATHMIPPETMIPTAENVSELLVTHSPDSLLSAPSILEDMTDNTNMLSHLRSLAFVGFIGAPISQASGKKLSSKGVRLCPFIGSTETGPFPQCLATRADAFNYQRWPADVPGIKWREHQDGLYELVFVRCDWNLAVFHTFPELDEYPTKDLYRRHPDLPDHWLYVTRVDDVVVLSSGEKLVPLPMEDALRQAPAVIGALITGTGRFSTSALIELDHLKSHDWSRREKLEYVSPYVDSANEIAPGHARLSKDRILFVTSEKPMLRSGKGSIIRSQTLKLYNSEIENLYNEKDGEEGFQLPTNKTDPAELEKPLLHLVSSILGRSTEISAFTDFFQAAGMDSTKALELSRVLKRAVKLKKPEETKLITPKLIYDYSCVEDLAYALTMLRQRGTLPTTRRRDEELEKMIARFSENLKCGSPQEESSESPVSPGEQSVLPSPFDSVEGSRRTSWTSSGFTDATMADDQIDDPEVKSTAITLLDVPKTVTLAPKQTVLLTGSTGSLGSYILNTLIANDQVEHIFALNRSSDAETVQRKNNISRGLTEKFEKVTFLQANLSHTHLGLLELEISRLFSSTSTIIHNAWPVNFNTSLKSFTDQIAGVRNLIELSASAPSRPHIVFVSSVGTTGRWREVHPNGPGAPEEVINDPQVPLSQGYSESKFASEHLLSIAADAGVSSTVCRVGQVAGPVERVQGEWNRHEWLPSLVTSSAFLKMLPSSLGSDESNVDWVPVDYVARILVELGTHCLLYRRDGNATASFFNIVNQHPVSWQALLPAVQRHLPAETKVVTFSEWFDALRRSGEAENSDPDINPALKLMEFWSGMEKGNHPSGLQTEKAVQASKTMRGMREVNVEWMDRWMEQWGFPKKL